MADAAALKEKTEKETTTVENEKPVDNSEENKEETV